MNVGTKKKKQMQFRYYEIPQGEPCLALLGEAWVRRYGDGVDCLHFHNYMEIGFCYDGSGIVELDDDSVPYQGNMITIIPKNYPHNTNSENFSYSKWEYLFVDVEGLLQDTYRDNKMFADELAMLINNRAWTVEISRYPEVGELIRNIMEGVNI